MGRKQGVAAEDTRQDLLDATMRVLLVRGSEGTRVAEIAREAGVTPGAVYNHFASKADLLTAAITERGPNHISQLLTANPETSIIEVLRQIGAMLPRQGPEMGPLLLELVVSSGRDAAVRAIVAAGVAEQERLASDVVRLGQDAHDIDPAIDAEAFSRLMLMLSFGSLAVGTLDLKPVDEAAWAALIDRVLAAVQAPSPPRS